MIGNSSKNQVTDVEMKALSGILRSKEHLCRNFKKVLYENYDVVRDHGGSWTFYLPVILDVDTLSLWEHARSYVYHHLGRDSWELADGTTIKFTRIHKK